MGEFRIGRKLAQHVYPDNARAAALSLFARNYATGPKVNTTVDSDGTQIPWNMIDSTAKPFTVDANTVTVSIAGDVTSQFNNGDNVSIVPTTPVVLPPVLRSIASVPAFADGFTTFDLNAAVDTTTTGGTIEDASAPTTDVPITPRTTGVVLISGVVTLGNDSGDPITVVTVEVQVDGVSVAVPDDSRVAPLADGQAITLPFLAEVELPIGTTSNIQIIVTGEDTLILADSAVINIQEVSVATG